ncbi:MAG: amino acid ABC transporter substrate-binding protein [Mailhella sp.]|nr:amino acid ABC transporter substrate-binding protein [Mailhella sp.]
MGLVTENPTVANAGDSSNELRVAVNATAPPFAFMENGKLVGFEVELHAEVAKRMGKKYVLTNIPFAGLAPGLQAKKWDASGNTWINAERMKMMDFSDPWVDAQLGFVTRKKDNITGPEQLKGKTVGAEAGTAEQRWLNANQEKYGPYTIRTYDRSIDILMDLMNGRLDAYLREQTRASYQIRNYPDLHVAFPIGGISVQGVAFRKGDPLRDDYNKILNEMKKDGTLPALYEKWIGAKAGADSSTVRVYTTPWQPK